MRFMGLKIGKSTEKNEKDNAEVKSATANHAADLEEHLNGRANNLKQASEQLKKLSDKVKGSEENKDVSRKAPGPIGVLEVGPEDNLASADIIRKSEVADSLEEEGEKIKLVEIGGNADKSPKAEAAPLPKEEKKTQPEESDDSLNKLFTQDEEEENPLANLVNSLPDVTTEELIEDLNEIKAIIKDWQKK